MDAAAATIPLVQVIADICTCYRDSLCPRRAATMAPTELPDEVFDAIRQCLQQEPEMSVPQTLVIVVSSLRRHQKAFCSSLVELVGHVRGQRKSSRKKQLIQALNEKVRRTGRLRSCHVLTASHAED